MVKFLLLAYPFEKEISLKPTNPDELQDICHPGQELYLP